VFSLDSRNIFRAQVLDELPWLEHGFGTRISAGWPDTADLATVKQIHSDIVLVAGHMGCIGEGDALITNDPGITLSIRTADCLPVLIADGRNRAVAAVHAGWRGVVSGIVPKTIEAMKHQFGTRPEDVVVAIGPGIGRCCFEVGPDVAAQFGLPGRTKVDLVETISRQLRRNDGTVRQFATANLCTVCDANLFHSYRRNRELAGRLVTTIRICGADNPARLSNRPNPK
jgi:YfiH family protein